MNANCSLVPVSVLIAAQKSIFPTDPSKLQAALVGLANQLSAVAANMAPTANDPVNMTVDQMQFWLHRTIKARRLRDNFFPSDLFADPAWDILLDLTLAKTESRKISISSACIAASVPTTTALRWVKNLLDAGILVRLPDPNDKRRHYIEISDDSFNRMIAYISAAIEQGVRRLV
jgi:hypothetical protein